MDNEDVKKKAQETMPDLYTIMVKAGLFNNKTPENKSPNTTKNCDGINKKEKSFEEKTYAEMKLYESDDDDDDEIDYDEENVNDEYPKKLCAPISRGRGRGNLVTMNGILYGNYMSSSRNKTNDQLKKDEVIRDQIRMAGPTLSNEEIEENFRKHFSKFSCVESSQSEDCESNLSESKETNNAVHIPISSKSLPDDKTLENTGHDSSILKNNYNHTTDSKRHLLYFNKPDVKVSSIDCVSGIDECLLPPEMVSVDDSDLSEDDGVYFYSEHQMNDCPTSTLTSKLTTKTPKTGRNALINALLKNNPNLPEVFESSINNDTSKNLNDTAVKHEKFCSSIIANSKSSNNEISNYSYINKVMKNSNKKAPTSSVSLADFITDKTLGILTNPSLPVCSKKKSFVKNFSLKNEDFPPL